MYIRLLPSSPLSLIFPGGWIWRMWHGLEKNVVTIYLWLRSQHPSSWISWWGEESSIRFWISSSETSENVEPRSDMLTFLIRSLYWYLRFHVPQVNLFALYTCKSAKIPRDIQELSAVILSLMVFAILTQACCISLESVHKNGSSCCVSVAGICLQRFGKVWRIYSFISRDGQQDQHIKCGVSACVQM